MYLVAGMAGLRQAELLGLRWYSIDWQAMKIRAARDTFTRGRMRESGKSAAARRGVPMAPRVARELELHFQRSHFSGDQELVFPNPLTGAPQQRSEVHRRFKRTLKRAALREVKFHGLRHTFATRLAAAGVPLGSARIRSILARVLSGLQFEGNWRQPSELKPLCDAGAHSSSPPSCE